VSVRAAEAVGRRTTGSAVSVRIQGLSCYYERTHAVRGIDLAVEPGEFFTLLGPSGCGKSTTLRAVAGFQRPAAGTIHFGDQDVTALPPNRRPTNYVFQNYALFPHMTVQDNVEYGLRRQRVGAAERARRAQEELDRVGMSELAARRPGQLSGGQQQRVALARALVNRPQVLLLDEPLSALDFQLRRQLREQLKSIQREVGTTSIFVTHDQDEALSMSDRIGVMNAGRIEQTGTPEDIYLHPSTLFVARFVGSANLLPGEVVAVGDGHRTVRLDLGATCSVPSDQGRVGQRCHVMVRPTELLVVPTGTTSGFTITATLISATYVGDHYEVGFRHASGVELTAQLPTLNGASGHEASAVDLTWDQVSTSAAHLIVEPDHFQTTTPDDSRPVANRKRT